MSGPAIVRDLQDGELRIGFNRPERKNAINGAMYEALAAALDDADESSDVRVVLFHGSEAAFCAATLSRTLPRRAIPRRSFHEEAGPGSRIVNSVVRCI